MRALAVLSTFLTSTLAQADPGCTGPFVNSVCSTIYLFIVGPPAFASAMLASFVFFVLKKKGRYRGSPVIAAAASFVFAFAQAFGVAQVMSMVGTDSLPLLVGAIFAVESVFVAAVSLRGR